MHNLYKSNSGRIILAEPNFDNTFDGISMKESDPYGKPNFTYSSSYLRKFYKLDKSISIKFNIKYNPRSNLSDVGLYLLDDSTVLFVNRYNMFNLVNGSLIKVRWDVNEFNRRRVKKDVSIVFKNK